jgi:hypothetical protein
VLGTLHLCPASPSLGCLTGPAGVTTRAAGYPLAARNLQLPRGTAPTDLGALPGGARGDGDGGGVRLHGDARLQGRHGGARDGGR